MYFLECDTLDKEVKELRSTNDTIRTAHKKVSEELALLKREQDQLIKRFRDTEKEKENAVKQTKDVGRPYLDNLVTHSMK